MNRRAFLTGLATVEPMTKAQTLTRRQFTIVAFVAALVCAFLPREAAEALLKELFGEQKKTERVVFEIGQRFPNEIWMHPRDYENLVRELSGPRMVITAIDRSAGTITVA